MKNASETESHRWIRVSFDGGRTWSEVESRRVLRKQLDADGCRRLQRGDIVCNIGSGTSYVVESEATDTRPAIGVRTIEICGSEWELVQP